MDQLGPNALGETLEPGRVGDCYLGLLLPPGPAGEPEAGTILIVAPATRLHPAVSQPAGSLVYQLLTGHPQREPGELVFVADLTCELRAWPTDTWAKVGVDPDHIAQAVISCWQDGEVPGLQEGVAWPTRAGSRRSGCRRMCGHCAIVAVDLQGTRPAGDALAAAAYLCAGPRGQCCIWVCELLGC